MKIQVNGEEHTARLSSDHAMSCYGQPVLIIEEGDIAIGPGDTAEVFLVDATDEERQELQFAGYHLAE